MSIAKRIALVAAAACVAGAVSASAGSLKTIYTFNGGTDGASPWAGLISHEGSLYGTTVNGGTGCAGLGCGTVFKVDPRTTTETVLYRFAGGADGQDPYAALIYEGSAVFGTTSGGSAGDGTVFEVNPAAGTEQVLYSFTGGADGTNPYAPLLDRNGVLYGTTYSGGAHHFGTVYALDPTTSTLTVLHSFNGKTGGGNPWAGLTVRDHIAFGTTLSGGRSSVGVVFGIDLDTGKDRTIYSFTGFGDGGVPFAAVTYNDGALYGTTLQGGVNSGGTAFVIDPATRIETLLCAFNQSDGAGPIAGLIFNSGFLYGTTEGGGTSNWGTVFKINQKSGAETVLYSFTGAGDGGSPKGNLVFQNGYLYGTTSIRGGPGCGGAGCGTVFKIKP